MNLSIVATLYQSAQYVDEFCRRAGAAACGLVGNDYEIVLVNDGSLDDSLKLAVRQSEADSRIVVIDLSRNFGHDKAMITGLAHARGDRVFLIDSDLEEEPEWLTGFSHQMEREACDVVYGVQAARKGDAFERLSGRWFYRIHRVITGMAFPENVVTARLMCRRYVQALLMHGERDVYMAGLCHITGFDQRPQTVTKHSTSETTYTLRRKLAMVVNAVTSFSNAPLIAIFYVGIAILLFASTYIAYLVAYWWMLEEPVSGWTSVMASIWLLGGLIISFVGVVGIYLSKIFSEVKRRPLTIVRHVYGRRKG